MSLKPRVQWHRWEAITAADWVLDTVRRRCRQFGGVLARHSLSCLVTHDTRFLAGQFARDCFYSLYGQGVKVSFCPTPAPAPAIELAIEQRRADCALVITAGNRPFWFNGFHALTPLDDSTLLDLADLPDPLLPFPPPLLPEAEHTKLDVRGPHLELLRSQFDLNLIRQTVMTLFVDPMTGATSGYLPALLGEGAQARAIEINRDPDPLFGRQVPQPVEAGVARLRKLVRESDSHFGVALSADGRALVAADSSGDQLHPIELGLLLADYLTHQRRQRGVVLGPVPEVDLPWLGGWERATGLRYEPHSAPAQRIAEVVARDRQQLLVGITALGEYSFGHASATPDASYATLLLTELIARSGRKLRDLVAELRGM